MVMDFFNSRMYDQGFIVHTFPMLHPSSDTFQSEEGKEGGVSFGVSDTR